MENNFLLIDDNTGLRDLSLKALREKQYKNVLAPKSRQSCVKILKDHIHSLRAAIIDFKLSDWLADSSENSIKFGDLRVHNGVELAQYILSLNSKIVIGIYSSYESDLFDQLQSSPIKDKVELISLKKVPASDVTKYISDFFDQFLMVKTTVNRLFDEETKLPIEVEVFYSKKILKCLSRDQHLWKAGEFAWIAGVGEPIDDTTLKELDYINLESYEIGIDKNDFTLESFYDNATDVLISTDKIFDALKNLRSRQQTPPVKILKEKKFIYELFIVNCICKLYLRKQCSFDEILTFLNLVSQAAQFESQKILFKALIENKQFHINSKEDVYKALKEFKLRGFPQILDIYTGYVSDVTGEKGIVKLVSISNRDVQRLEDFSIEFLESNHLEEDSKFEYTIYKPSISGTAYHIEPI